MIANTPLQNDFTNFAHDAFARSIFAAADEVNAAETRIKQAILEAAQRGDSARVVEIVTRWQQVPATEVLATTSHHGKNPAPTPDSP